MTANNKRFLSFLSVILAFCTAFVLLAPPIANAANAVIYVEDIKIYECEDEDDAEAEAKKWFADHGYVFSGINVNAGTSNRNSCCNRDTGSDNDIR